MNERRWTQADLSLQSNVNPGTLSRFLNGKQHLDVDQLGKIAQAFGLKPGDLLERSDIDQRVVQLQPIIEEIAEIENGDRAAIVGTLAAQVRLMKNWRPRSPKIADVVPFPQQRTMPRATEEFPIAPEKFIERDFDYPLEYHMEEVEEDHAAAGVTGVHPDIDMTAQVLKDRGREGRFRVVRVHGDSMSDGTKWSMEDGELWSVDTAYRSPRSGDTVAVYVKDEGSIFGIFDSGPRGALLRKRNKNYDPVPLSGEPDAWMLLGKVYRCEQSVPVPPTKKGRS